MAENNLSHAQTMQRDLIHGEIADAKSGRLYGFAALVLLIGAASFAAYCGREAIAGVFLGAGVLGIIGQFINGRGKRARD